MSFKRKLLVFGTIVVIAVIALSIISAIPIAPTTSTPTSVADNSPNIEDETDSQLELDNRNLSSTVKIDEQSEQSVVPTGASTTVASDEEQDHEADVSSNITQEESVLATEAPAKEDNTSSQDNIVSVTTTSNTSPPSNLQGSSDVQPSSDVTDIATIQSNDDMTTDETDVYSGSDQAVAPSDTGDTQPTDDTSTDEEDTILENERERQDFIELILSNEKFDDNLAQHINPDNTVEVIINLFDEATLASLSADEQSVAIAEAQNLLLANLGLDQSAIAHQYRHIPAIAVQLPIGQFEQLVLDNTVSYVQYDAEITASIIEVEQLLGLLDTNETRTITQTGEGVVIAVLDTGVDNNYDLLGHGSAVKYRECVIDDCEIGAHGTLMAGIMRSIAPDVQIVDIQILDGDGAGTVSDWLAGLEYVLENQDALRINVINMSLSTTTEYVGDCDAVYGHANSVIADIQALGISLFAASGNNGSIGRMNSPACLEGVTSVAATYADTMPISGTDIEACDTEIPNTLTITCFSNRDYTLDLLAPGTGIEVDGMTQPETEPDHDTLTGPTYGTSQATAITSSVAALMLDANPYLSPSQILSQLKMTGTPVNVDVAFNMIPVPRINGLQAVQTAENTTFTCNDALDVPVEECEALLALYNGFTGSGWYNQEGWNENFSVCEWYGITCSNGHVYRIDLDANGLSGRFNPITTFANLTELGELFVSRNKITGTIPAAAASSLEQLSSADFSYNGMDVYALPAEIGTFMNRIDSDWKETQTVTPPNVHAYRRPTRRLNVTWSLILFNEGAGYYEVQCREGIGGPVAFTYTSANKGETSVSFNGADANIDYYCRVRTVSDFGTDEPIEIISPYSEAQFAGDGEPLTFTPVADTFISSSHLDTNHGGWRELIVGRYTDQTLDPDFTYRDSYIFLDFGLDGLPLEVESAILRLYVYGTDDVDGETIEVAVANFAWNDAITYNMANTNGTLAKVKNPSPTFLAQGVTLPACDEIPDCSAPGNGKVVVEIPLIDDAINALLANNSNGLFIRNPNTDPDDDINEFLGATFCSSNPDAFCQANFAPQLILELPQVPAASNPFPPDDSVNIPLDTLLDWDSLSDPQGDDITFNLYIGEIEDNLQLIEDGLVESEYTEFAGNIGTEYFWRVDVVDADDNVQEGEVWSFWTTFCGVTDNDCTALVAFYEQTGGEVWNDTLDANAQWLKNPVCDWFGVTCENGRVTELNLTDVTLLGSDFSAVNGLSALRVLNLSNGELNGVIPLLTLPELEILNLSGNKLRAGMPDLSGLPNLIELNLSQNLLNGSIPDSLSNLNLEALDLHNNFLSGDPFIALVRP